MVSHCLLNVHSLEEDLAIYPGCEEEVVDLLNKKGVGIYQIPCPEVELSGIFRKALPKEAYDFPKIRSFYGKLARDITKTLEWYIKKGYTIPAILGAEGSPTCGIDRVGRWKEGIKGKKEFPRDIEFIPGRGVFMEEFQNSLKGAGISPQWIGIPGKSLRTLRPKCFGETLQRMEKVL